MLIIVDNVSIVLTTTLVATILQACEFVGYNVLRFCFHRKLALVGSCRVCLCDVVRERKPVPACITQLRDNMVIQFLTVSVRKLREDILMFILFNHPLDCPTCDQGGACELQDFASSFGTSKSRFFFYKHSFENLNRGPLVKTVMSRCIHCTRCVRFLRDICGFALWGTVGRGCHMEIGNYVNKFLDSEVSGNIIDLCPVGALTQKPYAFSFRPWDVTCKRSLDFTDSLGTNVLVNSRGSLIFKILPYCNDDLNEDWISDRARFLFDGLYIQRISYPLIKKNGFKVVSWETMLVILRNMLMSRVVSSTNRGVVLSSLCDCESFLAIKKLFSKFGISNFYNTMKRNLGSFQYTLNMSITDFISCEFCCCVGVFFKKDLAVLNLRIRKCVVDQNMLLFYLGVCFPLNHAVYYIGASSRALITLCEGRSKLCSIILKMQYGLFLFNLNMLNMPWIYNCFIMLKNYFIKNKSSIVVSAISTYGNVVGQNAINFNYKNIKDIRMLTNYFIMGCQDFEIKSLIPSFINKSICYWGNTFNKVALLSDYIIPTNSMFEQKGIFLNIEGRAQFSQKIFNCGGFNRSTWQILVNVGLFCGISFGFLKYTELLFLFYLYCPLGGSKSIFINLSTFIIQAVNVVLNGIFSPFIYNFYLVEDYSINSFVMQKCNLVLSNDLNIVL